MHWFTNTPTLLRWGWENIFNESPSLHQSFHFMITSSKSHTTSVMLLHCCPPLCRNTNRQALRTVSSTDCSPGCQGAFENWFALMWEDNHIYSRGDSEKEKEKGKRQKTKKTNHANDDEQNLTGLWRRLEMRFLCWGPEPGVECWGDGRLSGTPSLGLRCTGVPLGVGDLLIFFCFAVGVLQPVVGGESCEDSVSNIINPN